MDGKVLFCFVCVCVCVRKKNKKERKKSFSSIIFNLVCCYRRLVGIRMWTMQPTLWRVCGVNGASTRGLTSAPSTLVGLCLYVRIIDRRLSFSRFLFFICPNQAIGTITLISTRYLLRKLGGLFAFLTLVCNTQMEQTNVSTHKKRFIRRVEVSK